MKGYILESVTDDTYLQENNSFDESLHTAKKLTLKEATDKQRSLKLQNAPVHIRIYQDKEINALIS